MAHEQDVRHTESAAAAFIRLLGWCFDDCGAEAVMGAFDVSTRLSFPWGREARWGKRAGFSGAHDAVVLNVFLTLTKHISHVERKFFLCMRWHMLSCSKYLLCRVLHLKVREKFSCPPIPPLKGGVGAILRVAVCYSMDGSSDARPSKTPDRIE